MVNPETIWSSSQLPTLPSVAVELLQISRAPDLNIQQVVEVVKTDPAITAKILKATNSSFFGFRSEITSIDRAVPLLGVNVVCSLALSFSLVESATNTGSLARHYSSYWMQSVAQAVAAEQVAAVTGHVTDEYFMSGLLMDIGCLAMLKTIPDEYANVLERAETEQVPLAAIEQTEFGFDHVEIGARLLERWKIPQLIIKATRRQNATIEELQDLDDSPTSRLSRGLAVASAVGEYLCGGGKGISLRRLRKIMTSLSCFEGVNVDEFLTEVRGRIELAAESFSADTEQIGSPEELMSQANEQLAELSLRQHLQSAQAVEAVEAEKQKLQSENEALQERVLRDPLTKLHNRRFFDEVMAHEIDRCRRAASHIGVLFADVDRFKSLNDKYGHQFGDQVLIRIANVFSDEMRTSDIVARYGGEEFVILAGHTTHGGIGQLAERIRAAVEAAEICSENGERVPVTVSIGAAVAIPDRFEDDIQTRLIESADAAMYDSKKGGRNQVHVRSLLDDAQERLHRQVTKKRFSRWLVDQNVADIPTMSRVLLRLRECESPLGQICETLGYLSAADVARITASQDESNERFGTIARKLGFITHEQLVNALALQHENPDRLAEQLINQGVLAPPRVTELLESYKSALRKSEEIAEVETT